MTYSTDFRMRVLEVKEGEGLSFTEVSKRFKVAVNSVFLWSKNVQAKSKRNRGPVKIDHEALKQDVGRYPDAYQYERAERLGVSRNCVHFALKRLKITYKKKSAASPRRMSKSGLSFARRLRSIVNRAKLWFI